MGQILAALHPYFETRLPENALIREAMSGVHI